MISISLTMKARRLTIAAPTVSWPGGRQALTYTVFSNITDIRRENRARLPPLHHTSSIWSVGREFARGVTTERNMAKSENILLSTDEAAAMVGVTSVWMRTWRGSRGQGRGPAFEIIPSDNPDARPHYRYRLDTILDFMASRGASNTKLKNARRHALTVRRLQLARAADRTRVPGTEFRGHNT